MSSTTGKRGESQGKGGGVGGVGGRRVKGVMGARDGGRRVKLHLKTPQSAMWGEAGGQTGPRADPLVSGGATWQQR